jgi:uncharacterized protein
MPLDYVATFVVTLGCGDYEWDDVKAEANLQKHGIEYDVATQALEDEARIERSDVRRNYGERRICTTGTTASGMVTVVHTQRGDQVRLISARHANRKERSAYGNREKNV